MTIEKMNMVSIERVYANNGQHCEQMFVYTMCGEIRKADNKPHTFGGDYNDIQVKSSRATVCKGLDLDAYLNEDGAKRYAYVSLDKMVAYLMDRMTWQEFCERFATPTRESKQNGGKEKLRLPQENKAMIEWLER